MFDNAVGNIVLYMLYCVIIRFVIVIFVIMWSFCLFVPAVRQSSLISDSVGRGRDTKRSKLWYLWGWQWWQHSQHFAALASLSAPICCGYRSTRSTDRTDRISFQVSFQVPVSRCVSTALATYDLHMLHMRHCLYIESPTELLGQCLEPFDILTCKDKQSTGKWLYKGIPMASGGSSVEILCYWHASKQKKHGK